MVKGGRRLKWKGSMQNGSSGSIFQMRAVGVDPTRPVVQVEIAQVKGHQGAGDGDSGRGHLMGIIQADEQAGVN